MLKPDINIFLYADADVILARKKELTRETIQTLTNDYLALFKSFETKSTKKYIAIENIDVNNTLNRIMNETTRLIA